MTTLRRKTIAVVLASDVAARQREALRAAVGLSLRGDGVHVVLCAAPITDDPAIRRALATLDALGHTVDRADPCAAARTADATEVWT